MSDIQAKKLLRDVQEEGKMKSQVRYVAVSYTKNSDYPNAVFQ